MYDYNYPYKLERESKWAEAAKIWKSMGREEDAKACQLLADSIAAGDSVRSKNEKTVYSIYETEKGNFFSSPEDRENCVLLGRVIGLSEAVYYVSFLEQNRDLKENVITGMKLDFPELN